MLNLAPKDSYDRHTALCAEIIAFISHVGDTSSLILDPSLDSYYLMDSMVFRLPGLAESLGQSRAFSIGVLLRKQATVEERVHLAVLASKIRGALDAARDGMQVAMRENPALKPQLEGVLQEIVSITEGFLGTLNKELVAAEAVVLPPADYYAASTHTIDITFKFYQVLIPALKVAG